MPSYVSVPGSSRTIRHNARVMGPANPSERIEVTVRVRKHKEFPSVEEIGAHKPQDRKYLSREEVEADYGATDDDIAKIDDFANQHHLTVVSHNKAERNVKLSGTVQAFSNAFQVKLMQYEHSGGTYRGRTGEIYIPDELQETVEGIFGLDDRRQARPHIVLHHRPIRSHIILPNAEVIHKVIAPISYTPPQVADLYDFPDGNGTDQCIGILEFGGGYTNDDLNAYFDKLGLPVPNVESVSVDGVQNSPGNNPLEDSEVALDIEVAGAIAPNAKIVVYFAPFTERGWVDALTTAIHDNTNKPSVISISWGFPEGYLIWTKQAMDAVNEALQEAALMGVTVCCASGDDGSNDQADDGYAHVDFPASSPYVLACGGTRLDASDDTISSEVVWNDGPRSQGGTTGGGISEVFPQPSWQVGANVPPSVNLVQFHGRGVPDVAGDADGNTGYTIRVHEQDITGAGGTSAVAPLWAGLIARINQKLGPGNTLGYFNPLLYTDLGMKAGVFHDITVGNNDIAIIGGYSAGKGWDACTGWGSPDGDKLLKAL